MIDQQQIERWRGRVDFWRYQAIPLSSAMVLGLLGAEVFAAMRVGTGAALAVVPGLAMAAYAFWIALEGLRFCKGVLEKRMRGEY